MNERILQIDLHINVILCNYLHVNAHLFFQSEVRKTYKMLVEDGENDFNGFNLSHEYVTVAISCWFSQLAVVVKFSNISYIS